MVIEDGEGEVDLAGLLILTVGCGPRHISEFDSWELEARVVYVCVCGGVPAVDGVGWDCDWDDDGSLVIEVEVEGEAEGGAVVDDDRKVEPGPEE